MLAVIDYGVGNLYSIKNMLQKAGVNANICSKASDIEHANKIILPGIGHFDSCMQKLNASGLRNILDRKVWEEKVPVLGICVGLQMLMENSAEGKEAGLGWVKGKVIRFDTANMMKEQKIPNMGWLEVNARKSSELLKGLETARFYFAHSYHVITDDPEVPLLTADYGYSFTAAIAQDNLLGVQFHPEKSHRFGMQLFKNFSVL